MGRRIQNWAFVAPRMSRDLGEYFAGVLDCVKVRPEIFLHYYAFADSDLSPLADMDGLVSYTVPPKAVWDIFAAAGKPRPPTVAITMRDPTDKSIAYAHVDPDGVAGRIFDLLRRRNCRSYAFCSNCSSFFEEESAALLAAYRRVVRAATGKRPALFSPISSNSPNMIPTEVGRFAKWAAAQVKPCGICVHSDAVARNMLDSCRLRNIAVPRDLRIVGTGNSAIYCERTCPTLSSYAVDHERTGFDAAVALQHMIDDRWSPKRASFEVAMTDIVERASTIDERGSTRLAHGAYDFIHAELDRGVAPTVRNIAYHFNVSRRKLEKDFRDVIGHTLHEEIAAHRMDALRTLLRATSEPVGKLALRVGFGTVTQANRAFRARYGMTMTAYRKGR